HHSTLRGLDWPLIDDGLIADFHLPSPPRCPCPAAPSLSHPFLCSLSISSCSGTVPLVHDHFHYRAVSVSVPPSASVRRLSVPSASSSVVCRRRPSPVVRHPHPHPRPLSSARVTSPGASQSSAYALSTVAHLPLGHPRERAPPYLPREPTRPGVSPTPRQYRQAVFPNPPAAHRLLRRGNQTSAPWQHLPRHGRPRQRRSPEEVQQHPPGLPRAPRDPGADQRPGRPAQPQRQLDQCKRSVDHPHRPDSLPQDLLRRDPRRLTGDFVDAHKHDVHVRLVSHVPLRPRRPVRVQQRRLRQPKHVGANRQWRPVHAHQEVPPRRPHRAVPPEHPLHPLRPGIFHY
ncbi:hypothetical protein TOPH_05637, partial [Tolypocladium ophioglossoides CBS 100239]